MHQDPQSQLLRYPMLVVMNINIILVQCWKLYEKVFGDFDVIGKGLNEAIRCWVSTYPQKNHFSMCI
jgi:hypothetical protein